MLAGRRILVFDRDTSPGAAIASKLRGLGCEVVTARPGEAFARLSDREYVVDPGREEGFRELAAAVCAGDRRLAGVVECLGAAALPADAGAPTDLDDAARLCLLAPMRLAYALTRQTTVRPLPILIVAAGTTRVYDGDEIDAPRALGAGVARVLPQEHPGLRVAHIDVDAGEGVADAVAAELAACAPDPAVAIRGGRRFTEAFEPDLIRVTKPPPDLPASPVVLITGGLGYMGLTLAEALFSSTPRQARAGREIGGAGPGRLGRDERGPGDPAAGEGGPGPAREAEGRTRRGNGALGGRERWREGEGRRGRGV